MSPSTSSPPPTRPSTTESGPNVAWMAAEPPICDLRLGPALIVPVTSPPRRGWVEVTDGAITHVGPQPSSASARETVALDGRMLLPGFVNTHCHTSQQLGRG